LILVVKNEVQKYAIQWAITKIGHAELELPNIFLSNAAEPPLGMDKEVH